jgi:hypothetical protein
MPDWVTKTQSLFTAVAPFISGGTALFSGIKVFLG